MDADEAAGVGLLNVGPLSLGPTMSLDLEQRIFFTPTGLDGAACYQNRDTLENHCTTFGVPSSGPANLSLALGLGTWDISFLDVSLLNLFRNDINLELRPNFNYIVGSWPPVGSGLFSFDLIDQDFPLAFNKVANAGIITVNVVQSTAPPGVPEPASLLLCTSGLLAFAMVRRRRGHATE